jgi:hypothetical protein
MLWIDEIEAQQVFTSAARPITIARVKTEAFVSGAV